MYKGEKMNSSNKLSSFIGSVIVAFAITLFLPSMANAHGSHGSKAHGSSCNTNSHGSKAHHGSKNHGSKNHGSKNHGSKAHHGSKNHGSNTHGSHGSKNHGSHGSSCSTSKYNKYKALADKYLKAYYKCYNYKYYRLYVYYMKKANACKPNPTADNCTKYKDLADKYLAAYKRCGYYCYYRYYLYYMNLYKKCEANINKTGKVCGLVFEDSNTNGEFDKESDKRLANVTVKITDSKGKVHTVKTNKQGWYCAQNIAEGTASVDIDETTLPDNPTQVVGTDPTDVDVKAHRKNWEERNGYTFPAPTGNVCGTVYEDSNKNGTQDADEKGAAGIKVTIIDANGDSHEVTTDDAGNYCLKDVVEGSASVTVDVTTLPDGATFTGTVTDDITVVADQNNPAGKDGYTLPEPVGNACGTIFEDSNQNGVQDSTEVGASGIKIIITDHNGDTHEAVTNDKGNYCVINIPEGPATVNIDRSTLPDGAELTYGLDPNDINIIANKDIDAGADGYILPIPTGTIFGKVLEDVDSSRSYDSGDTGLSGVTLNITDSEGNIHTAVTDANGQWTLPGLPEGEATVEVVEDTLPDGYRYVYGENPSTVNVVLNAETDAGMDGYTIHRRSSIYGWVKMDTNGNKQYDSGDVGIPGVAVILTDVNGNEHTLITDENGLWFIVNLPGGETKVDVDDSTLPDGLVPAYGSDPKTKMIIEGPGSTNAGIVGYGTKVFP